LPTSSAVRPTWYFRSPILAG